MALRHDANDENLSRIADELIGVRELLEKIDHAQDALLCVDGRGCGRRCDP